MEYAMLLDTNNINVMFSAEAVSSPMPFADDRVLQFKVETKYIFLHFSNLLLFTILPVVFFSISAWHPTEGRAPF